MSSEMVVQRFWQDVVWAVMMFRARRLRKRLLFSERENFDRKFVRRSNDGRKLAQPYAIYHATTDDFRRATAALKGEGR